MRGEARSKILRLRAKITLSTIALYTVLYLYALLGVAAVTFAEPALRTEVTPRAGSLDDLFIFTVTVQDLPNAAPPLLSGGSDFSLELLGPQTSISFVNGVVKSRSAYVYRLQPKHEGELLTPQAEIEVNGSKLTAAPIKVQIQGGRQPQSGTAPPGADRVDTSGRLFVQQSAAPATAYQGQQVVNTVSVFTRVELSQLQIDDLASDGFWQETLAEDERSTKVVNGAEYVVVQIKKALFPLRSGLLTLPARTLSAKVQVRRRAPSFPGFDLFDDPMLNNFFGTVELQDVSLASNGVSLEVKPLPPASDEVQPLLGVVPLVGATSIKLSYQPDAINVGESKTITVTLVSEGNLNPLKTLTLTPPTGVKVYEERPETTSDKRGALLITHKTFKYSVVPLRPGLISIPGLRVAYFDPQKEEFLTADTSDIAFPVRGQAIAGGYDTPAPSLSAGLNAAETPGAALNQEARGRPIPTLPPIPIAPPLKYEEPTALQRISEQISVQLAILILAEVIAVLALLLLTFRLSRTHRRTTTSIDRELNTAGSAKDLERVLRKLAAQHIHGINADSSLDEVRALVAAQVPNRELALAIRTLLDELEVLQYGGSAESAADEIGLLRQRLKDVVALWR